jgi:hypothetical protein
MKKILIILGVIIILVLGAAWAYVFIYGVPENADEIFARFDRAGDAPVFTGDENSGDIDVGEGDDGMNEGVVSRLRQLTTRPVAGAVFTTAGIRYVERGTGHVYEIDLASGEERIVSGTTLQRTIRAVFSPDGTHVALTSESDQSLVTAMEYSRSLHFLREQRKLDLTSLVRRLTSSFQTATEEPGMPTLLKQKRRQSSSRYHSKMFVFSGVHPTMSIQLHQRTQWDMYTVLAKAGSSM